MSPRLMTPITKAAAVTPSDTTDLTAPTRAIYIGGAGNLKIDTLGGDTVTLNALAVGVIHWVQVKRVYSTGTTATNIVALY